MPGVLRHLLIGIAEGLIFLATAFILQVFSIAFIFNSALPLFICFILILGNIISDFTIFPFVFIIKGFNIQKALKSSLWRKVYSIDEYITLFFAVVFFVVVKVTKLLCIAYPVAFGIGVISHLVADFFIKEKGKNGFLW